MGKAGETEQAVPGIVARTLDSDAEPEFERVLIGEAIVIREGDHYRIEQGGDRWDDLTDSSDGCRSCGAPLSLRGELLRCRNCGSEFRVN